jgi:4-diphosphocytidyl-2-C-methyl-D-erythritol kinase
MNVQLISYAKVNLGLSLHGKREDGYHELSTIIHEVELGDIISCSLSKSNKDTLIVEGTDFKIEEDNLINQAISALRQHHSNIPFYNIKLTKNIPIGGGMGGGSSNALAVLLFVADQTGMHNQERIDTIAASLGSDTNFFIKGSTAICKGRGEKVKLLEHKKKYFNIICPKIHCSTIEVFKQCNSDNYSHNDLSDAWDNNDYLPSNDLEVPCFKAYPKMHKLTRAFRDLYKHTFLSGSGSTLFTVHDDHEQRDIAHAKLNAFCIDNKIELIKTQSAFRG